MQITVRTKEFGEALQSDVIRTFLTKASRYMKRNLNLIDWNKISDKDIEITTDIEKAKNAGRKRGALVLWSYVNNDEPYNFSLGKSYYYNDWQPDDLSTPNLRKHNVGRVAYIIDNAERFETAELRKQRAEAKKGAIALMTDTELKKKNKRKYEDMLDELHRTKYADVDVVKYFDDYFTKYSEALKYIENASKKLYNEVLTSSDREVYYKINELADISNNMNRSFYRVGRLISEIKGSKDALLTQENRPADDFYKRSISKDIAEIVDYNNELRKFIDEINKKFLAE